MSCAAPAREEGLFERKIRLQAELNEACWAGDRTEIMGRMEAIRVSTCPIDITPINPTPPLHIFSSAKVPDLELIRWFLDLYPSSIDAIDSKGNTALCLASGKSDFSLVQLLVERGANRFWINNDGQTPTSIALTKKRNETARYLNNPVTYRERMAAVVKLISTPPVRPPLQTMSNQRPSSQAKPTSKKRAMAVAAALYGSTAAAPDSTTAFLSQTTAPRCETKHSSFKKPALPTPGTHWV